MKDNLRKMIIERKNSILFIIISIILIMFFFIYAEEKFDKTNNGIEATDAINIESGVQLEQNISDIPTCILSSINIMFGTHNRTNNGELKVSLYDNEKLIQSWDILSASLIDNAYQTFKLDKPLHVSKNSKCKIIISQSYTGENGIAVWTNQNISNGYKLNGVKKTKGTICYSLTYRNERLKTKVVFIGIAIALLVMGLILMRINEVALMSGILGILLMCFIWICPLGMAPDESNHFLRAYEIANVGLVSQHIGESGVGGNYLPNMIRSFNDETAIIDWDNKEQFTFGNTALYAPVSYLPQAIGIKIVGCFTNNVSQIFYGGRLANAICAFVLCILALKIIPFGKRILFLIMTFPLTLQEMISMSPDGFTIAISLFFIAYILNLCYGKKKVNYKDIAILSIVGLIISLCKIVYVVLLLLLLMIPNDKFKSKKQLIGVKGGLLLIAGILNVIWLKISMGFLVDFNPGVNSPEQIKFILCNIYDYFVIVIRTIIYKGASEFVPGMIGSSMGALNIPTNSIAWFTIALLFVYELCNCFDRKIEVHKYDCAILLVTFILGCGLIVTSLYVQWTPVANEIINGIQGRYFTPLISIFAYFVIFVHQQKLNLSVSQIKIKERGTYYYMLILCCNGFVILDMIGYYIADLWR